MNVSNYAPIGVREKSSVTIPWGNSPAPIPTDIFAEVEVRDILSQESRYCGGPDNGPNDLDPAKGRCLFSRSIEAPNLLQGKVDAVEEGLFDVKGTNTYFGVHSKQKNMLTEVTWKEGEIQSVREERVLSNGNREVVDIKVDAKNGVLTYLTDLVPPTKP